MLATDQTHSNKLLLLLTTTTTTTTTPPYQIWKSPPQIQKFMKRMPFWHFGSIFRCQSEKFSALRAIPPYIFAVFGDHRARTQIRNVGLHMVAGIKE